MCVTERGNDGAPMRAKARGIDLTPKGKIHLWSSGDSELARGARDYMIACTKRLKDLLSHAISYHAQQNDETAASIDTRNETIELLVSSKEMSEADAKCVVLQIDRLATFPMLLGNGKHRIPANNEAGEWREENGLHYGVPEVRNAMTALQTVRCMPGTVTTGSRGNASGGLNKTGRNNQNQVRNHLYNAFKRYRGRLTIPVAIKLIKRYAALNKDNLLEMDPNVEEGYLNATEQARSQFDSAEDMLISAPAEEPMATPAWRAQHGLASAPHE